MHHSLDQGFSSLGLEVHFPAEFCSNPNETHTKKLINVRITRYSQIDPVWRQKSAGKWTSMIRLESPRTRLY